jgi:hypothetical protein
MSIRYLAEELYRKTRQVEDLEKALAALEIDAPLEERTRLERELLRARHELDHLRSVLDAKKERPLI